MLLKIKNFSTMIIVFQTFHIVLNLNSNEKSFSTSISRMIDLLEIEMKLIQSVENYAAEVQLKVDALKNLVHELKDETLQSLDKREEYLSNPLNSFSLIRRLYNDWPKIELFMAKPVGQKYVSVLQKLRPAMPTVTDFMEASAGIFRIQEVYDLQVNDLARGRINGKQYHARLKSIDSYFMGFYLFTRKLYYPAGFWLNSSIKNFEEDYYFNKIRNFGKEQPLALYAEVLVLQSKFTEALRCITRAKDLQLLDPSLLNRMNEIHFLANTKKDDSLLQFSPPAPSNYELGCRGQFVNPTLTLFCLYNTTTTPFLRLAPLKMEVLSLQPYIVIYHEVISDAEIEYLKALARPNLARAQVYDEISGEAVVSEERTSQYFWFEESTDDIIERMNKRIIDITGFDINEAELLQTVNYGLGGHYDLHYDFFNVSEQFNFSGIAEEVLKQGDRISTLLFYLSDVEQGGATVFPKINISVFPVKGSALLWYNLNNKLEADERTLHAACPVLVGSKWVANKWIGAYDQAFKKPCYK